MDTEYLKETVGPALAQGLASVALLQPEDCVEFLGRYLLKYVDTKEKEEQAAALKQAAIDEDVKVGALKSVYEKAAAKKTAYLGEQSGRLSSLYEKLDIDYTTLESSDAILQAIDERYTLFLETLKNNLGAASAYLGKKCPPVNTEENEGEEEESEGCIKYFANTGDAEYMKGNILPLEKGVSADVWKVQEVEEDEEEDEEEGEAKPKEPPKPVVLNIPNVLREKRMTYFRFSRLGAFLATALDYNSTLHPGAFPKGAAAAAHNSDSEEEGAAGGEEDGGGDGGGGGKVKPITKPVQLCVALDTLGQGNQFSAQNEALLLEAVARMRASLERAEEAIFQCDLRVKSMEDDNNALLLSELQDRLQTDKRAVEERVDRLGEGAPDSEKRCVSAETKLGLTRQAVMNSRAAISTIACFGIEPAKEIVEVLRCVAQIIGLGRGDGDWLSLKKLVNEDFFSIIDGIDGAVAASTVGNGFSRATLERIDGEELDQSSVAAGNLLRWAIALVDFKRALAAREEEANRAAAGSGDEGEDDEDED